MWAIIYPGMSAPDIDQYPATDFVLASCIPLTISLFIVHRRAKKAGALAAFKSPYELYGPRKLVAAIFWQLDTIGVLLLIAVFALILVPLTIAGGVHSQWKTAKAIAPLVIGFLLIPVWIVWEMKCKHPMVPFKVGFLHLYRSLKNHHVANSHVVAERSCSLGCPGPGRHAQLR